MPEGFLAGLGPWSWLIAGLVLMGLETLSPGIFLVWFGIAAIGTAMLDWLLVPGWQANLMIFAALSIVSVAAGRSLTRRPDPAADQRDARLNARGPALIGRTFVLDRPIASGEGRVRIDDSVWRITGPDMEAGRSVRVLRLDGATLIVEAVPG